MVHQLVARELAARRRRAVPVVMARPAERAPVRHAPGERVLQRPAGDAGGRN